MDTRPLNMSIVTTKLHRPHIAGDLVMRARLHERLDRSAEVPLTLVSAPAGYGKSMLVSHWADVSGLPTAWLSLDRGDSEVEVFLEYFVAAVRTIHSDACEETADLLEGPTLPPQTVLARTLLNDLDAVPERVFVVLDDYHRIKGTAVHELLNEIFEHPPRDFHLVIASRRDPPLRLAKMRGLGHLAEVRLRDLQFTTQETDEFLKSVAGELEIERFLEPLQHATEGWAAGLRLVVLASRYQTDVADFLANLETGIPSIREYLFLEVIEGQAPAVRSCLLKTAVLDRFCAALCDVMFDSADCSESEMITGRDFITALVQGGLFAIELDSEGNWYRFHHLFQDLLSRQLRQHATDDEIADLHLRASGWFENAGFMDEAIDHAFSAGRPEQAARLVKSVSPELMQNEQISRLETLLDKLPQDVLEQDANLLILIAFVHYQRMRIPEWAATMERAQTLIDRVPPASIERKGLQAGLDALRSAHCYLLSDLEQAERLARGAKADLPAGHRRLWGYATLALALVLHATGRHGEAMSTLQTALADQRSQDPRGFAHINSGKCLISWAEGDLPEMRRCAETVEVHSQANGLRQHQDWARIYSAIPRYVQNDLEQIEDLLWHPTNHPYGLATVLYLDSVGILVLTLCSRRKLPEALEIADTANHVGLEIGHSIYRRTGDALRAEIDLRSGDHAAARRWARAFNEQPLQAKYSAYLPELTLAKVLVELDSASDRDRVSGVLNRLESHARDIHFRPLLIQTLAFKALMLDRQGDRPAALEKSTEAILLAEPGGIIRPFVDLGQPMEDLLQRLARQGDTTVFLHELLEAFAAERASASPEPPAALNDQTRPQNGRPSLDALTNRELDVLELLAKRLQNKEIAARLCISTQTVGSHLKRIYDKLDVHGRRQAVQRAIETGILDRRPSG